MVTGSTKLFFTFVSGVAAPVFLNFSSLPHFFYIDFRGGEA